MQTLLGLTPLTCRPTDLVCFLLQCTNPYILCWVELHYVALFMSECFVLSVHQLRLSVSLDLKCTGMQCLLKILPSFSDNVWMTILFHLLFSSAVEVLWISRYNLSPMYSCLFIPRNAVLQSTPVEQQPTECQRLNDSTGFIIGHSTSDSQNWWSLSDERWRVLSVLGITMTWMTENLHSKTQKSLHRIHNYMQFFYIVWLCPKDIEYFSYCYVVTGGWFRLNCGDKCDANHFEIHITRFTEKLLPQFSWLRPFSKTKAQWNCEIWKRKCMFWRKRKISSIALCFYQLVLMNTFEQHVDVVEVVTEKERFFHSLWAAEWSTRCFIELLCSEEPNLR